MSDEIKNAPSGSGEEEPVVSTREAAEQLGVSVRTIQLWVESGRLTAWKTAGNHRRIYQWSVDEFKHNGRTDERVADQDSDAKKPSILVVEDDRTTQVYYESMLQMFDLGHDLHFASDGIQGLVSVGRYQPWLLILDIEMPRMNGIEMVSSLEMQPLTKDLEVIAITNLEQAEAERRGLPASCAFYQKPISVQDLGDAIENAKKNSAKKQGAKK